MCLGESGEASLGREPIQSNLDQLNKINPSPNVDDILASRSGMRRMLKDLTSPRKSEQLTVMHMPDNFGEQNWSQT